MSVEIKTHGLINRLWFSGKMFLGERKLSERAPQGEWDGTSFSSLGVMDG